MDAIFDLIYKMAQGAGFVVWCVLLVRLLMKGAPKVWSYALWTLVLVRLIVPVFPQTVVSIVPEDSTAVAEFDSVVHSDTHVSNDVVSDDVDMPEKDDTSPSISHRSYSLQEIIYILWPFGVDAMAVYGTVSLILLKRKLRFAVPVRDNIYAVDYIDTPFVVGIIRPRIYLPSDLDEDKAEYIIAHEQYHIRRFDPVVKLLSFVLLCFYWFSPMIWVAFIFMCRDMEMSCDEAVMKKMDGDVRADYADALLQLSTGKRWVAPMPLAFGEGDPEKRIRNILDWKKPAFWVIIVCIIVLIVSGVCLLTDPIMVSGDGSGLQLYTGGELLTQYSSMSYVPDDGSYYRQIALTDGTLMVSDSDFNLLYWGSYGRPNASGDYDYSDTGSNFSIIDHLTRDELVQYLADRHYSAATAKLIMADYPGENIEVQRYYDVDAPEEPKYTLIFFDGELGWFAESDCARIYQAVEIPQNGAFDAAVSPWQWTSKVTAQDVTWCSVTYRSSDRSVYAHIELNAADVANLISVLNGVDRSSVTGDMPELSVTEDLYVTINCGEMVYMLQYENNTVHFVFDSERAVYSGDTWYIDDPALNEWMESWIGQLTEEAAMSQQEQDVLDFLEECPAVAMEDLEKIDVGMTREEVVQILGSSGRDIGSGVICWVYYTEMRQAVRVSFDMEDCVSNVVLGDLTYQQIEPYI